MLQPDPNQTQDPTARRILLADDEPHITMVLARKLRGAGFDVETCANGEEALRSATKNNPDLIITDLQMPRLSGIELAQLLRQSDSTVRIPIIMLTARGYVLTPEALGATNIKFVMSKPFSAREMLTKVIDVLGTSGASGLKSA